MNPVTHELKAVIERLADQGVLSATDTRVIYHVLDQVQYGGPASAPQTLSGPYWEARHKALHDDAGHAPDEPVATDSEAHAGKLSVAALR